jgi:hypothetical protein
MRARFERWKKHLVNVIISASNLKMMQMRTTIDLPEAEHALFRALARARDTTLSAVILDLCGLGLASKSACQGATNLSAITGLPTIASAKPVTNAQVAEFLNER